MDKPNELATDVVDSLLVDFDRWPRERQRQVVATLIWTQVLEIAALKAKIVELRNERPPAFEPCFVTLGVPEDQPCEPQN